MFDIITDRFRIPIRERLNPFFGKFRCKRAGIDTPFTIISNNCWAGHVYRYFNLPYNTPTVGLYIFSDDYVRFVHNLRYYMDQTMEIIALDQSKYKEILIERGHPDVPIGKLEDIEIVFLHYHSASEALDKWNRRKERIVWDNLYFKMSEQNYCELKHLQKFDQLPTDKKFVFVSRDYGLGSQIIFKEYQNCKEVLNDTTHFRRYINVSRWLTGKLRPQSQ